MDSRLSLTRHSQQSSLYSKREHRVYDRCSRRCLQQGKKRTDVLQGARHYKSCCSPGGTHYCDWPSWKISHYMRVGLKHVS
eukprot:26295_6